jgi:signal transduction histidine kinase
VVMNGTGKPGLGLIGMRERLNSVGGSLAILSNPGRGTELTIMIPSSDPPGAFNGV